MTRKVTRAGSRWRSSTTAAASPLPIVPSSATPKAVPISRIAPFTAEAMPLFSGSTLLSTAVVIGAQVNDMPSPMTTNDGTTRQ